MGVGILIFAGLPKHGDYSGFILEDVGYVAPEINNHAPPFTLTNLALETRSLENYPDKIVIINFWATWCIPCQIEMQELQELYQSYTDKIYILGVNLGESPQAVAQWVDEYDLTYDILLDPMQSVAQLYQIRGQPSTYVIDANGIIRNIFYGPVSMEQLEVSISTSQNPQ